MKKNQVNTLGLRKLTLSDRAILVTFESGLVVMDSLPLVVRWKKMCKTELLLTVLGKAYFRP